MCDPISAATAAITIGSAAFEHQAQAKSAKNERANARATAKLQNLDIGAREQEASFASAREVLGTQRDATEIEGAIQAAAGEAGVTGQSLRLLLGDTAAEAGRANQASRDNRDITLRGLQRERAAVRLGATARINQARGPSAAITALRIGGTAAAGAAALRKSRQPTPSS